MNKKGFVSSIFLWYLLLVTTMVTIIELQMQKKIETFINCKESMKYLTIEVKVIEFIKCEVKNNRLSSGTYSIDEINLDIVVEPSIIKVEINDPFVFILEYDVMNFDTNSI